MLYFFLFIIIIVFVNKCLSANNVDHKKEASVLGLYCLPIYGTLGAYGLNYQFLPRNIILIKILRVRSLR